MCMNSSVKSVGIFISVAAALVAILCCVFLCAAQPAPDAFAANAEGEYTFEADYSKLDVPYNAKQQPISVTVKQNGVALAEDAYTVTYTCPELEDYASGSTVAPVKAAAYSAVVSVNGVSGEGTFAEYEYVISPKSLELEVSGSSSYAYNGASFSRNVSPLGICAGDENAVNVIVTYTGAFHSLAAGERPVEADTYAMSFSVDNPNYKVGSVTDSSGEKSLTITKRTLVAKADDVSVTEGREPALTVTVTGFVNNEDVSVIDEMPSVRTTATEVGVHTVTPYGGKADNYDFTYEPGTLTINSRTASGSVESSAVTIAFEGVFAPNTSYTGRIIDTDGEEGKNIDDTVNKYRMANFTATPEHIFAISAVSGGMRQDSLKEGEEGRIEYATLTFHNVTLDSSKEYFIVFMDSQGGVTKITNYEYANGTLKFNAYAAEGTVIVYRDSQTLIVWMIIAGAVVLFFILLLIASKVSYYNDKKDLEAAKRRRKKSRSGYRW